jgi:hypothetical protein
MNTKSTSVLDWQIDSASTKVDLRGTDLLPQANGEAKIEMETNGEATRFQAALLRRQLGCYVLNPAFSVHIES